MDDGLDQLVLAHPVLECAAHVESHLVGAVQGHYRCPRDQAAIPLGEAWALPDVPEQHVVGQLHQLRREVTDHLLGGGGLSRHSVGSFRLVGIGHGRGVSPINSEIPAPRHVANKGSGDT
jgi:hypothetical protein